VLRTSVHPDISIDGPHDTSPTTQLSTCVYARPNRICSCHPFLSIHRTAITFAPLCACSIATTPPQRFAILSVHHTLVSSPTILPLHRRSLPRRSPSPPELHATLRHRAPHAVLISVSMSLQSSKQHVDVVLKNIDRKSVCLKCFRCFGDMLQVFRMDVVKVDHDVTYVAIVVHVYCKRQFPIFHLSPRHIL
jgi:hypothetical protein